MTSEKNRGNTSSITLPCLSSTSTTSNHQLCPLLLILFFSDGKKSHANSNLALLNLLNRPFTPSVSIHSDITVLRNLPPFTSPIERSIISVMPTVEGTLSRLRPTPRTVRMRVPLPYLASMHRASWRVYHTFCSTVYVRSPTCDSPSYPYQELRPAPCLRYST